jgi:signal transduction histidine kinase
MLEPQARARSLALARAATTLCPSAWADRDRTQQILINLVGNAIKFTGPGGRVTLSCEARAENVLVHVADTGCGIEPENVQAIFDPFVQAGRHREEGQEGVGLGLAISRDLARAMDGDLRVRSMPGLGSTFTLSLPAARRVDQPVPAASR